VTRLRLQLEGGVQALVFAVVLAMAFMTSHIQPWNLPEMRNLRWFALAELGAFAVALVIVRPRPRFQTTPALVAGGLLVSLALFSASWAADSRASFARAASFSVLLVVAWAIATGVRGDADGTGRVVLAILAAVGTIAVAGLIELWHSYDQAVLPATRGRGARFNGIGENPNQVAMLIALALPLVLWAFSDLRSRWAKAGVVVLGLFLDVSLVASGSRGAIIAALAGCLTFVMLGLRRRRLIAAVALTAIFTFNFLATQLPPKAKTDPISLYEEFGATPPLSPQDVNARLPLESEFGFPGVNRTPVIRHKLIFSSGRREAWQGAIEQAAERPLLGYGFGMEDRAFVDRYYLFVSSRVENSFISMLLQLGPLGVVLLLLALGAVIRAWVHACRWLSARGRRVAAACGGLVVAGIVLALTQSYLTSAGSPPTAPFWVALFLLGGVSSKSLRGRREGERDEREQDASQRHGESGLDVVGREHDGVGREEHDGAASGASSRDRERGAG
jgi:O-antigen ligase